MVELTFGELKTALICCTVYKDCNKCSLSATNSDLTCKHILMSAAMNCINVLEKDLADMTTKAEQWEKVATKHEQEIIQLHESLDR